MSSRTPHSPIQTTPGKSPVALRNNMVALMDATGYSRQQAGMILASLAQYEQMHPEANLDKIPPSVLIQCIAQIAQKQGQKSNIDGVLGSAPPNNIDSVLGSVNTSSQGGNT